MTARVSRVSGAIEWTAPAGTRKHPGAFITSVSFSSTVARIRPFSTMKYSSPECWWGASVVRGRPAPTPP